MPLSVRARIMYKHNRPTYTCLSAAEAQQDKWEAGLFDYRRGGNVGGFNFLNRPVGGEVWAHLRHGISCHAQRASIANKQAHKTREDTDTSFTIPDVGGAREREAREGVMGIPMPFSDVAAERAAAIAPFKALALTSVVKVTTAERRAATELTTQPVVQIFSSGL
jgi:hypothetical protein